jgi:hypothetical protein
MRRKRLSAFKSRRPEGLSAKVFALENRADPLVADFYQSRVSKFTMGERHYGELKTEADGLYPLVVDNLRRISQNKTD